MNMTEMLRATEAEVQKITKGKLVEDLKGVLADAEELLKATADQTGERIMAARTKAEESLKAAKARLAEQEGAVMAKTRAAAKATEDYVRINPWKAVGIAAGAGFALCLLATLLGQSIIEAGERMIIKGGRAIQVAEKEAQKLFQ
jgi:ElaB/YqjD/DUF883 family membrane-anchored ribosome-binding protein